jgi:protein-disulfide isomerase-like protein with CxxC motif
MPDVAFLAIDVGESADTVRAYVANSPFPYPVLLDENRTLFERYGIGNLPSLMVIDAAGRITFLETGVTDARTLREEVAEARAGA